MLPLRLTVTACIAAVGLAQMRPAFEVASIKRSRPDTLRRVLTLPGGDLELRGHSLKYLAAFAWDLPDFRISGGPKWIESETFDISAKLASAAGSDTRLALQQLLADRFQLTAHLEQKELPVYALVMARRNGRPGTSLKKSKQGGCTPPESPDVSVLSKRSAADARGGPALARGQIFMGPISIRGVAIGIDVLARYLTDRVGRQVVDRTGLEGSWDLSAEWELKDSRPATDIALFAALEAQLGLKLESSRDTEDVLVIDSAELPGENGGV